MICNRLLTLFIVLLAVQPALGAITYIAAGTAATTDTGPAFPGSINAGDLLIQTIAVEQNSASVSAGPSGFTLVDSITTTASPTGFLTINYYVYAKIASGSETGNSGFTTTGTPSANFSQIIQYRSTLQALVDVEGSDEDGNASYSVTASSNIELASGDRLLALTCLNDNWAGSMTSNVISQTSCTFETVNVRQEINTSVGSDVGFVLHDALVTAGGSTAAPTHSFTAPGNIEGATIFVRLRETSGAKPHRWYYQSAWSPLRLLRPETFYILLP